MTSPVLFNIFINDIFDGIDELGVGVEYGSGADSKTLVNRICGLLFADDCVGITEDRDSMERMCAHFSEWAASNELQIGIAKCGLMVTNGDFASLTIEPQRWTINGESIPLVESYPYLGIRFTSDLAMNHMVTDRFTSSRSMVASLTLFLRSSVIPMHLRMQVLKSVVLPRLLYGCELYGMNKRLTERVQSYLNRALRAVLGLAPRSTVSSVALWRECGVPPICAMAAGRRARAFQKCLKLHSWVAAVAANPLRTRQWSYFTGTQRWMNRYGPRLGERIDPTHVVSTVGGWVAVPGALLSKFLCRSVWAREERCRPSRSGNQYMLARYERNQLVSARIGCYPELSHGLMRLAQCRLDGIWWSERLARHGFISSRYTRLCPCCQMLEPENLVHVLLRCRRWNAFRDQYLVELITSVSGLAPDQKVLTLLGGEVYLKMKDWLYCNRSEPSPDEYVAMGGDSDDDEEDPTAERCFDAELVLKWGCLRVASFLSMVIRARAPIIRSLRGPLGFQGGHTSAAGQRPMG